MKKKKIFIIHIINKDIEIYVLCFNLVKYLVPQIEGFFYKYFCYDIGNMFIENLFLIFSLDSVFSK